MENSKGKITPCLWFDNNLREALDYYAATFTTMKVKDVSTLDGTPNGPVQTATFEIEGQAFQAINGGPMYKFTDAVSFAINCETQAEIHHYWGKLSAGGVEQQCGWVKDRFGLSWQVVPNVLGELLGDRDRAAAQRAMQAMLQMKKFDIAAMKRAHASAA
jgi:predicted 3-demethylubiquinone-9 3-methyltransferase (glyoxalase superfamily)